MQPVASHSRVLVLTERTDSILSELAEMLSDSFRHLGHDATHRTSAASAQADADVVVLLGQGPHFEGLELLDRPDRPGIVLWDIDPLPPPGLPTDFVRRRLRLAAARAQGGIARRLARRALARGAHLGDFGHVVERDGVEASAFLRLEWILRALAAGAIDGVFVSSPDAVATLREHDVEAQCLPVGWHPAMGRDEGNDRDLDVVFLGTLGPSCPARVDRVARLDRELAARGIALTIQTPPCLGAERAALLNRARVAVNIRTISWHPELVRFVLAASCGALVVTETPITDTRPFGERTHFVAAPPSAMADRIATMLERTSERADIVAAATELLRSELTMDRCARSLLSSPR